MRAWLSSKAAGDRGSLQDASAQLDSYQSVFSTIGWVAVGIGVLLTLLSPILSRYMYLDTLHDADDPADDGADILPEPRKA